MLDETGKAIFEGKLFHQNQKTPAPAGTPTVSSEMDTALIGINPPFYSGFTLNVSPLSSFYDFG